MLVVVERNGNTVFLEHVDALLHEVVPRIEHLPLLVSRVLAVFSDDQNRVHGEPAATAPQRLGNRRVHRESEFLCPGRALVSLRLLVDVERHHLHVRLVPRPVPRISHQEPVPDVLRVRQVAIHRRDDGDSFRGHYVLQNVDAFVG